MAGSGQFVNPRADLWRQVRQGVEGYTAVRGLEAGELIQASGEIWRQWRNGPLFRGGQWLLGGTAALLMIFFLVRGRVRLAKPRTGIRLKRWSLAERVLHWYTALLFLLLALTGLILFYGKILLIPLLGKAGFASVASLAKWTHNLMGPLFITGLAVMILIWFKDNLWRPGVDWAWFKAFGGLIGKKHPPAGRMNAGEKGWFWLLVLAGSAVSITGLLLDLPLFGLGREVLQLSHLLHVVAALVLLAASLGHVYIGTIGTEGALEGMINGEVDLSWARQHHNLWLQELEAQGQYLPRKGKVQVQRPKAFFQATD